jgi:hypothetical protein
MLNYLSLSINDEEIRKELFLFRFQWLDRIYKLCIGLVTLNMAWTLITFFGTKTDEAIVLLSSANNLLIVIYWTICRRWAPSLTFAVAPLYLLVHTIELNLLVRD